MFPRGLRAVPSYICNLAILIIMSKIQKVLSSGMKIFVEAQANAPKEHIEKIDDTHFKVAVVDPPVHGKANRAIIRVLAQYFVLKPYQIELIAGKTSKQKTFKVYE